MATAGRVAPLPRDKFVKGEPYEKLDVVEYNGNLYMAKKASSGVLPTDTEYWMLAIDLTGKLDTTGDTENNTVTFTSNDAEDPTAWQDVAVMGSKEKHTSLFSKISTMFSNMRYLYKLLGTADISDLGSVTQAIATLSGNVGNMKGISSSAAITTEGEYALDAREKNASVEGTLANQLDVLNSNFNKCFLDTRIVIGINRDIKSIDDAPVGICQAQPTATNTPFSFWSTVITFTSDNNGYMQQIAIPWLQTEIPKIRIKNNGVWYDWRTFTLT